MARLASYSIQYQDKFLRNSVNLGVFHKLEYAKKENEIGYLYLTLPNIFPPNFFHIDGRIIVYRSVGALDPYVELNAIWYVRVIRRKFEGGNTFIHLVCHDGVDIVDRRIVAYDCNSTYTKKTEKADEMIYHIMMENFGSSAVDTNRDISGYLDIAPLSSVSVCPELTKTFCRKKVLTTLQEICDDAYTEDGTYIVFDVVYNGTGRPIFRIYTGMRGDNRGVGSPRPFVFSIAAGNIEYATVTKDHLEEYNYIYAGGRGQDDDRVIAEVYNQDWINISPINRREDWMDARSESDPEAVRAEAKKRLNEAGPKLNVNGHIVQTNDSLYGVHYRYGDVCIFSHEGTTLNIHLDSVHVVVNGNDDEDVRIFTRNLEDNDY